MPEEANNIGKKWTDNDMTIKTRSLTHNLKSLETSSNDKILYIKNS